MTEKLTITREQANEGITPRVEQDRVIARNTPKNVIPYIKGAYVALVWKRGRPYYRLQKTYYYRGHRIVKVLLHYGVRPPRGAKIASGQKGL